VPDRAAIARQFQGRAAPSTLARWITGAIEGAHHNRSLEDSGAPEPAAVVVDGAPEPSGSSLADGYGEPAPESGAAAAGAEIATRSVAATLGSGDMWVAWSATELHRLDQWRSFQLGAPSRAEAVRQLATMALGMPPA
jgi:hypothetical protein